MKPIPLRFAVDTDYSEYREHGYQGLRNCYVVAGSKDKARDPSVRMSAGLTELIDTTDERCRGSIKIGGATPTDDIAYYVFEGGVYKITWDGTTYTKTNIGVIPGVGLVVMARNSALVVQIGVVNSDGRYFIIEGDVITPGPSSGLPDWVSIEFLNQYLILAAADGRMFSTALANGTSINGLDFATAEARPDRLVTAKALGKQLIAFGGETSEPFLANSATVGFPFDSLAGGYIQKGCKTKHSVQNLDSTLFWIGNDDLVHRLAGYTAKRVSNRAVEAAISAVTDPENIEGYTYSAAGDVFYGISHSTFTWEFNAATGLWHERQSSGFNRWRVRGHLHCFGKNICADITTGSIYAIDKNNLTENGDELVSEMRSELVSSMPENAVINSMVIDLITGRAALSGAQVDTNPVVLIDWSDDGGATWSNEVSLSLGSMGDRERTLRINRLGSTGRRVGRTFRIRTSDPHVRELRKAIIEVS